MQRKKPSRAKQFSKRRKAALEALPSVLELVREGVRRFVLADATLDDFNKAVRLAARRGKSSYNPLPGKAFRKIVKDAVAERKRSTRKRPR
jgi:DNA-binding NarL/FixJ family response regulator